MQDRKPEQRSLTSGFLSGLSWSTGSIFKPSDPTAPSKKFEAYGLLAGLSIGTTIGILTLIFGLSAISVPLGGLPLAALIPIWIAYVVLSAGLYAGALKYLGRVADAFADMYAGRKITNQQIGTIIGSFLGLFLVLSMAFFPFIPIPLPTVALLLIEEAPMVYWQLQALTIVLVTCAFGSIGDKFGQLTGFFITEYTIVDGAKAAWHSFSNWWHGKEPENVPVVMGTNKLLKEGFPDARGQAPAPQLSDALSKKDQITALQASLPSMERTERVRQFKPGASPRPRSVSLARSPSFTKN